MAGHNKLLLCLMISTVVVLVINFGLSAVNNFDTPLYKSSISNMSAKYKTGITPAGWTFSIWGVIYTWQCLWILFAFVYIFRKVDGAPAYTNPIVLSPAFFGVYTLNIILTISWTFLFDREEIEASFVDLFLVSFTLYICLYITQKSLAQNGPLLASQGRNTEIWLHRMLVHNGLGIYAAWTSIATLLNMAMVMIYRSDPGVDIETAGTVALGFLLGEHVVYVFTDLFFFDRYTRYTFTPYLVVCHALVGSLAKNWNPEKTNSIFTAVLLGVAIISIVIKVIAIFWRHCTRPLNSKAIEPTTNSYTLQS